MILPDGWLVYLGQLNLSLASQPLLSVSITRIVRQASWLTSMIKQPPATAVVARCSVVVFMSLPGRVRLAGATAEQYLKLQRQCFFPVLRN